MQAPRNNWPKIMEIINLKRNIFYVLNIYISVFTSTLYRLQWLIIILKMIQKLYR